MTPVSWQRPMTYVTGLVCEIESGRVDSTSLRATSA
jgi:hypothetical protein